MEGSLEERDSNGSLPFANISVLNQTGRAGRAGRVDESKSGDQSAESPPPTRRHIKDTSTPQTPPQTASGKVSAGTKPGEGSSRRTPTGDIPSSSTPQSGPLGSPFRRSLAGKGKKEGSEGTPSMGSSFSDIDGTGYPLIFFL